MQTIQIVALSLALAFISESMVEYLFGQLVEHVQVLQPYKWLLMYVSAAAGVGLAFYYSLDLFSLITQAPPTTIGILLSGLSVGRGANFVHDFVFGRLLTPPQP